MINANGEIVVDQTTSCTIDDALLLMLGITIGTVPESVDTCLDDILDAEKDQAEADYIEAKAEKLSDDLIKTAFDNLTKTTWAIASINWALTSALIGIVLGSR